VSGKGTNLLKELDKGEGELRDEGSLLLLRLLVHVLKLEDEPDKAAASVNDLTASHLKDGEVPQKIVRHSDNDLLESSYGLLLGVRLVLGELNEGLLDVEGT